MLNIFDAFDPENKTRLDLKFSVYFEKIDGDKFEFALALFPRVPKNPGDQPLIWDRYYETIEKGDENPSTLLKSLEWNNRFGLGRDLIRWLEKSYPEKKNDFQARRIQSEIVTLPRDLDNQTDDHLRKQIADEFNIAIHEDGLSEYLKDFKDTSGQTNYTYLSQGT